MSGSAHHRLSDAERDRVAMYVLGGLRPGEVERFEAHLGDCAACRDEVVRLRPVADDLVLSAPSCPPPPGLRDRILERVRRESPALHTAAERSWVSTDVEGIDVAPLWNDAERGRHTLLVRMRPGAAIPLHRHAGPEECFVVEGDLREGSLELGAGDYVRHHAGSEHGVSTRDGCLLLVTASQDDRRPSTAGRPGSGREASADPEAGC